MQASEWRLKWLQKLRDRISRLELALDSKSGGKHDDKLHLHARKMLLDELTLVSGLMWELDEIPCELRCGALCCFFGEGELSVQIDKDSVTSIRKYLRARGKQFADFITERDFEKLPKEVVESLVEADFIFLKDGKRRVHEVMTREGRLSDYEASNLPMMADGRRMWTEKGCRPCAFLSDERRCNLYTSGIRPACCRAFLCSTSLNVKIARYLKHVDAEALKGLDLASVNSLSRRISKVFDEELFSLESRYDDEVVLLARAYLGLGDLQTQVDGFKAAQGQYKKKRGILFESSIKPGFSDYLRRLFS
jgi:hypothetical protein